MLKEGEPSILFESYPTQPSRSRQFYKSRKLTYRKFYKSDPIDAGFLTPEGKRSYIVPDEVLRENPEQGQFNSSFYFIEKPLQSISQTPR